MNKVDTLFRCAVKSRSAALSMRSVVVCVTIGHGSLRHNHLSLRLVLEHRLGLVSLLNLTLVLDLISVLLSRLLVCIYSMPVRAGVDGNSLSR